MRVIHVTNNDYDGAGRAVIRLHNQLTLKGVDSYVALVFSSNENGTKKILKIGYGAPLKKLLSDFPSLMINFSFRRYKDIVFFIFFRIYESSYKFFYKPNSLFNFNYRFSRYFQLRKHIRDHDIIVLHSTQGILNPIDIVKISQEFKVKIIMRPLDMEAITGGCHFNYQCNNWQSNCGSCPQINSKKIRDTTSRFLDNKRNSLNNVPIHWIAPNSYIKQRLGKSPVVSSIHKISSVFLGVDKERYSFVDQNIARKKHNLPSGKKIILFGCFDISDVRKGGLRLKEVLKNHLDSKTKEKSCLVTFGTLNDFSFDNLGIDWIHLNQLSTDTEMNYLYRSADLYVSPSLDDLGPAIAVEAFMNDLPIIAFNLGVGIDLIIEDLNGNLIDCFNLEKFGKAISTFLSKDLSEMKTNTQIKKMQKRCKLEEEALLFIEKCI